MFLLLKAVSFGAVPSEGDASEEEEMEARLDPLGGSAL